MQHHTCCNAESGDGKPNRLGEVFLVYLQVVANSIFSSLNYSCAYSKHVLVRRSVSDQGLGFVIYSSVARIFAFDYRARVRNFTSGIECLTSCSEAIELFSCSVELRMKFQYPIDTETVYKTD